MGIGKNAYWSLEGKPEENRLPGRPRRSWVENIKLDLEERGTGLVWLRVGINGGLL
jgi:hypothetical protein